MSGSGLVSVDDYRSAVLASVQALHPIDLPLSSSHGCVLATDVTAPWPLPSFDNSAMDGYALLAADIIDATAEAPVALTVIDDVPAGFRSTETIRPGTAVRIMTGAPVPHGTTAVVPVERTDGGVGTVLVSAAVGEGGYIRRAAEDVMAGETVLTAGTLIGARQIAILAAVGCGVVLVHPRPRVAVISTGTELVEPGTPLRHGLISDSNGFMLVAAAKEAGADAYRIGPVVDNEDVFRQTLEDQLHRCDLVLTSGGVSMGAFDTVKTVLSRLGSVEFTKVAMHPGMPQGHGVVGDERIPIITLPGNPVSSYISFEVFVRPVIRRMMGVAPILRPETVVQCTAPLDSSAGKRQFARARFVADGQVEPTGTGQGSHVMGGLAVADALIVIPEDVTRIEAGERVTVLDLR